jgi:hypothetical protein
MTPRHCIVFGGVLVFAYSLTGPAFAEAMKAIRDDSAKFALSSADHPAFDLPHTHFEIESEPVPSTVVEIAATGRQVGASAGTPAEVLKRVSASFAVPFESVRA